MTKPRITKVKGSPYWNCDGVLGRNPRLAYWTWYGVIKWAKERK